MAQTKRFVLADIGDGTAVHIGAFQDLHQLCLALGAQFLFQHGRVIKVIFQRALAAGGDEDEFLDARRAGLVDGVLHQRAIDQGHDLFGDRFRRGQKPRSQTSHRKNRFCYFLSHVKSSPLYIYVRITELALIELQTTMLPALNMGSA